MLTTSTQTPHLRGFSLVELAVVLVLLSLLFTGILIPQSERQNQQQESKIPYYFRKSKKACSVFFIANKKLPCPATAISKGESVFAISSSKKCHSSYGFLPFKTLGLQGIVNQEGLFLDEWKRPIRYNLSNKDHNQNGHWDWLDATNIAQTTTLSNLVGNFTVCDKISCSNIVYADQAVVTILSQGKLDKQSPLEKENSGEKMILSGNKVLGIANDKTFIYLSQKNLTAQNYFDDQLLWIAPVELYYYLIDK